MHTKARIHINPNRNPNRNPKPKGNEAEQMEFRLLLPSEGIRPHSQTTTFSKDPGLLLNPRFRQQSNLMSQKLSRIRSMALNQLSYEYVKTVTHLVLAILSSTSAILSLSSPSKLDPFIPLDSPFDLPAPAALTAALHLSFNFGVGKSIYCPSIIISLYGPDWSCASGTPSSVPSSAALKNDFKS